MSWVPGMIEPDEWFYPGKLDGFNQRPKGPFHNGKCVECSREGVDLDYVVDTGTCDFHIEQTYICRTCWWEQQEEFAKHWPDEDDKPMLETIKIFVKNKKVKHKPNLKKICNMKVDNIIGVDSTIKEISKEDDDFLTATYLEMLERKAASSSRKRKAATSSSSARQERAERRCLDCHRIIPPSKPSYCVRCIGCYWTWRNSREEQQPEEEYY